MSRDGNIKKQSDTSHSSSLGVEFELGSQILLPPCAHTAAKCRVIALSISMFVCVFCLFVCLFVDITMSSLSKVEMLAAFSYNMSQTKLILPHKPELYVELCREAFRSLSYQTQQTWILHAIIYSRPNNVNTFIPNKARSASSVSTNSERGVALYWAILVP